MFIHATLGLRFDPGSFKERSTIIKGAHGKAKTYFWVTKIGSITSINVIFFHVILKQHIFSARFVENVENTNLMAAPFPPVQLLKRAA